MSKTMKAKIYATTTVVTLASFIATTGAGWKWY